MSVRPLGWDAARHDPTRSARTRRLCTLLLPVRDSRQEFALNGPTPGLDVYDAPKLECNHDTVLGAMLLGACKQSDVTRIARDTLFAPHFQAALVLFTRDTIPDLAQ